MTSKLNRDFKFRILRLFVTTIGVLLCVFVLSTYRWQSQRLQDDLSGLELSADRLYRSAVEQDAQMLMATLTALTSNHGLQDRFAVQDRDSLLRQALPIFQKLRANQQITHFYFIRPDHTVLLRVHMPQRMGDQIQRLTLLEAERTQSVSYGVELGVMGTFTLRVVSPWIVDGHLLGYVELGKEIDGLAGLLHHNLGISSEIMLDKRLLQREAWEAGMNMLGRRPTWEQLSNWVINGPGLADVPPNVLASLNVWRPGQVSDFRFTNPEGRKYLLAAIPLQDVAHRTVGALLIRSDVSDKNLAMWRGLGIIASLSVLAAGLAAIAFWMVLAKVERRYHHSEEKLRSMFHMSPLGMALIDLRAGRYVETNQAFCDIVGYSSAELTHLSHLDLTPSRYRESDAAYVKTLDEQRQAGPYQKEYQNKMGYLVPVSLNSMKIQGEDGQDYIWSLVENISNRLEAERQLRQKTEALARSNAELEQFAYVTSHDLRQPLRSIGGYVTLLERQCGDRLDEEGRQFIKFVVDGVRHMDRLIIDVLDYSRIGRLSRPMVQVSLAEIMDEVRFNLRAALDDNHGALEFADDLPVIFGDRTELLRLLQNLVGNALKFRAPDRAPVVSVTARVMDEKLQVTVQDNGIGIASANVQRVFGIFQRLHSRDQYEGTGIGLAVCKKIVEHHGGSIWTEPAEPYGSRFCFTLPLQPCDPARPETV